MHIIKWAEGSADFQEHLYEMKGREQQYTFIYLFFDPEGTSE